MWRILLICLALPAAAQRVALLIGNADYAVDAFDLRNPVNDIEALGNRLIGLGFEVTAVDNAGRDRMAAAITRFGAEAEGAELAVIFYAGHGVQAGGENYLIPADFTDARAGALPSDAVTASAMRAALERARPSLGVIILDACRDNPLASTGDAPPGLARSAGGAGLLIAYATDPGNVAFDGEGDNSAFTSALLRHLDAPGLDARLMFGRVRQAVVLETGGAQIPWVEESVIGEHSFNPAEAPAAPDAVAAEIAAWRALGTDRAAIQGYLAAYPAGLFADEAAARLARLNAPAAEAPAGLPDPGAAEAALVLLGYLPDEDVPEPAVLRAYGAWSADAGTADPGLLTAAGAQTLLRFGARTARQIRTDMTALRLAERSYTIASEAYAELALLLEGDPAAEAVLAEAAADLVAIEARRGEVLARLDASRTYYATLIDRGREHFTAALPIALGRTGERGLDLGPAAAQDDAQAFVDHVVQSRSLPEGSYAWLSDFLPS